jgi:transposase
MRQRTLAPHLELDQLEQRYRQASDPVARSQWQILWLLAQGHSTKQVVQTTGYSETWIGTIAKRYNADGPDGVGDRRHANPGAASLLSDQHLAELDTLLDGPAPDGGLWTGPKIAKWMTDKLGHTVHAQRGWEVLQHLNYRSYVPRPRHAKADQAAQEEFQKKAS